MLPEIFTAGFSLYLFGIAFAPFWTPHVTERIGRSLSYSVYLTISALFNLGAGLGHNVQTVLVCRFFAGFFGGPCLVLLEGVPFLSNPPPLLFLFIHTTMLIYHCIGSFADVWSAETTNTYYAFQGIASFWGAGFGVSKAPNLSTRRWRL